MVLQFNSIERRTVVFDNVTASLVIASSLAHYSYGPVVLPVIIAFVNTTFDYE